MPFCRCELVVMGTTARVGTIDPGVVTSIVPPNNTVSGKVILDWTEI